MRKGANQTGRRGDGRGDGEADGGEPNKEKGNKTNRMRI